MLVFTYNFFFKFIKSQKMKYGYLWWIIDAENKIYVVLCQDLAQNKMRSSAN